MTIVLTVTSAFAAGVAGGLVAPKVQRRLEDWMFRREQLRRIAARKAR